MSYVRNDFESIKSKLNNSPNKNLFIDVLDDYLRYYDTWKPDLPALNPHQFKEKENWNSNFVKKIDKALDISVAYKKMM